MEQKSRPEELAVAMAGRLWERAEVPTVSSARIEVSQDTDRQEVSQTPTAKKCPKTPTNLFRRKGMKARTKLRIGGVIAVAAAIAATSVPAEPLKIRFGWTQPPHHMAPLLYQKTDLMEHYGKSYVVELSRFQGSTPQMQALAIDELDVAALAPTAFALAVTNAGLDDARIVADLIQDGAPGHFTQSWVTLAESGIDTAEELRGKRLATNAIGSTSDATMRAFLRKHGIADEEVTSVEMNVANMPAMLLDNKVDLINLQPMFAYKLGDAKYNTIFTAEEVEGRSQALFLVMRAGFIEKHRDAIVDFWADYMRAVQWFTDPVNHDEAVQIAMDFMKQPKVALDYAFTDNDFYHDPYLVPDVDSIQATIDRYVKTGILQEGITISPKYVDLSLVEDAKKQVTGE
jgi:NitT/TauT family transport system substrate-binding protein